MIQSKQIGRTKKKKKKFSMQSLTIDQPQKRPKRAKESYSFQNELSQSRDSSNKRTTVNMYG